MSCLESLTPASVRVYSGTVRSTSLFSLVRLPLDLIRRWFFFPIVWVFSSSSLVISIKMSVCSCKIIRGEDWLKAVDGSFRFVDPPVLRLYGLSLCEDCSSGTVSSVVRLRRRWSSVASSFWFGGRIWFVLWHVLIERRAFGHMVSDVPFPSLTDFYIWVYGSLFSFHVLGLFVGLLLRPFWPFCLYSFWTLPLLGFDPLNKFQVTKKIR